MIYIEWRDLDIDEDKLVALTDDEGAGSVRRDLIERAITDAEAEIDGYVCQRYQVPLSPVPDFAKKLARDIAAYNLYSRRPDADVPEAVKDRYGNAVTFLKAVAAGKAHLDAAAVDADEDYGASGGKTGGAERIFGRDNLDEF